MHPPLTLDVVGEAEEAAVSPPTLTLLARVERLEEQICQLAGLQDKQLSPGGEQRSRSPEWSEPSTPPSVERRSKSAMAVLGETVTKGTVLERVANLEHMQAAISRTASPTGKSPTKVTRSLFSTSPVSKPNLKEESIVDKVSEAEDLELPLKEAYPAANGHLTDNESQRLESVLAASEQAGKGEEEPQSSVGLLTKQQEESESGGSNTRTEPVASTKEEEESTLASTSTVEAEQAPSAQESEQTAAAEESQQTASAQEAEHVPSTERVTNSTHDSRSPPLQEQDKKLPLHEMENNHRTVTSAKETKPSKGKPWKRLQNYLKKKMHSMSSSKHHHST